MHSRLHRFSVATIVIAMFLTAEAQEKEAPEPCMDAPEARQFDFWLGTWDVRLQDGTEAGVNTIEKEQGGCVLVERWTSSRGGTGMSLNYYDPVGRQWVQNWVGADGSVIDIRGNLEDDGSMLLDGSIRYIGKPDDDRIRGRWTPLDDGRVRQHFEVSTDGGETWTDWFDGFYTRRENVEP